jgi:hypothetical protein
MAAAQEATEESDADEAAADTSEEASDDSKAKDKDDDKSDKDDEDEDEDDGDERTAPNAIYLDLGGPGLIYSLNYDRAFGDVAVRLGFSYISISATATSGTSTATASATMITVPLTASYIGIGSKTHIFELGAGLTFMYLGAGADGLYGSDESASASAFLPVGTALVGYRLQPKDGGFMFRVGASPLFGAGGALPWGYLSLGATF